jgi:uncharacterized SAM-binding protein YcdF (DUF218 family)
VAETPPVSRPRVIAVCGYSDGRVPDLHAICVARLRRAEREAAPGDIVLLSGWARHGSAASEAELMAEAWSAPCRELVVDRSARSTLANVRAAARVAREADASEVVLVTSGWHGRRAAALLRAALRGSSSTLRLATTGEAPSIPTRIRELACWTVVPLVALGASASWDKPT